MVVTYKNVVVTITGKPTTTMGNNNYDYTSYDNVLYNVFGEFYDVFYSGQDQGRDDHHLLKAINDKATFHIYYRRNTTTGFTYLGNTTTINIIQQRTAAKNIKTEHHERLLLHIQLPKDNAKNEIVPEPDCKRQGKYKYAVLDHAKFPEDVGRNPNLGFYCF
jgi:hypothetical protein